MIKKTFVLGLLVAPSLQAQEYKTVYAHHHHEHPHVVVIEHHDDHHHHHKKKDDAHAALSGFAISGLTNLVGYSITGDVVKSTLTTGSTDLVLGVLHKKYYKNKAYWIGASLGWVTSMALINYITSK